MWWARWSVTVGIDGSSLTDRTSDANISYQEIFDVVSECNLGIDPIILRSANL